MFSDDWPPFAPRTSYTRFRAYSLLQHGGDDKAAARTLAERYGTRGRRNGHADPAPADSTDSGQLPIRRPLTEMGNAERFVDQFRARARFCHPWGTWLPNDGKRWQRDQTGTVRRWAKQTHRAIYAEAAGVENDDQRQAIAKWAHLSEKSASVAATLKLAESEEGIPILPEQMDADPLLFNVENGTVNLRTGQLQPHNPLDYITKLAPVMFDPEASAPTFLAFLERILPDLDVRSFVQRAVGHSLTGDTSEQCLFFLHGVGANGKTTLLTALQAMMGDYARQAAPELLVSRGGDRHPTELADLFGARLVTSVEVDEGKRLAETLVKQMTGGDRMKARFMRADFFEWTPTHKLFLAANHHPEIRGTDYAIWRRIYLVPFTVTIPPAERDNKLPAKLAAELSGILNWAIGGCLDWQRNGLGVPPAVKDATEAYRAEQDVLADFLAEHCVIDPQAYAVAGVLYKVYIAWCEGSGMKPISSTAFGRRLTERGFRADKPRIGGKQTRIWRGLGLATPTDDPSGTRSGPRYG
jgi:putative DNA primase/helicase